jgi:hypothetical protein
LPEGKAIYDHVPRLRERVVELEERIALIESLRSPQMQLLRFKASQLPALADSLRRFPPVALTRGDILYGFQATRNEPLGVHYLLFQPADNVMSPPFPEWHWRESGADPPISYWIDPYWAKYYDESESQSLVFVPHHHVLSPVLHSFDETNMDAYLQTIMEIWFPKTPHVKSGIPKQPLFLFTPSREVGFDITIEVLDFENFSQIRERIGWINENLELLDAIDTAAFVKEGAFYDYRRRVSESLNRQSTESEQKLFQESDALETEFLGAVENILDRLTNEVQAILSRAQSASSFVDLLTDHMVELEKILANSYAKAQGVETAIDKTVDESSDFDRVRLDLEDQLLKSLDQADQFMDLAQPRVKSALLRMKNLRSSLDRLRYG